MIFVTIGTQEPFDRLIKAMDELCPSLHNIKVIAQISRTKYRVNHMEKYEFLTPAKFNNYFSEASLIVSHAGMGTIISALVQDKPVLIMPRLAKYGEHRNDHQLATAKAFEKLEHVHVAYDVTELREKIKILINKNHQVAFKTGKFASKELLGSLQEFIHSKRAYD